MKLYLLQIFPCQHKQTPFNDCIELLCREGVPCSPQSTNRVSTFPHYTLCYREQQPSTFILVYLEVNSWKYNCWVKEVWISFLFSSLYTYWSVWLQFWYLFSCCFFKMLCSILFLEQCENMDDYPHPQGVAQHWVCCIYPAHLMASLFWATKGHVWSL